MIIAKIIHKVEDSLVVSLTTQNLGALQAYVIPRERVQANQRISIGASVVLELEEHELPSFPLYGVSSYEDFPTIDEHYLGRLFRNAGIWTVDDLQSAEAMNLFVSSMRQLFITTVNNMKHALEA